MSSTPSSTEVSEGIPMRWLDMVVWRSARSTERLMRPLVIQEAGEAASPAWFQDEVWAAFIRKHPISEFSIVIWFAALVPWLWEGISVVLNLSGLPVSCDGNCHTVCLGSLFLWLQFIADARLQYRLLSTLAPTTYRWMAEKNRDRMTAHEQMRYRADLKHQNSPA